MLKEFILLFLVLSASSFSQITFQKTYGGVLEEECDAVVQTEDGGFILAASTKSYGNGSFDLYIIRTDQYGDTLWTRTFGGTRYDTAKDILKLDAENYLIAGSLDGKVCLIKIKDDGSNVWTKVFGNEDDYVVNTLKKTLGGGFVVCGNKDLSDYFIMKTDSNGDSLWTKEYENGSAVSIDATIDSGYILMIRQGDWLHPQNDFVIVKTDSFGDSLWAKVFGSANVEIGYEVEQTADGGFMLAGRKDGPTVGDSDFYMVKTDSSGEFLWDKIYGGDDVDRAFTAMQTADGGFVLGGYTESFNVGYFDFYIVRTNSTGDTLWTKTFGGEWQEEISDIEETSDGGFAAVGYTYSFGASNFPDIYFVKTDANGLITGIEGDKIENEIQFTLNQNYPNPFNPSTKISWQSPVGSWQTLKVYDLLGREVATLVEEYNSAGRNEVEFDPALSNMNLASGIYFYQLKAGNYIQTKKMVYMK